MWDAIFAGLVILFFLLVIVLVVGLPALIRVTKRRNAAYARAYAQAKEGEYSDAKAHAAAVQFFNDNSQFFR